MRSMQGLSCLIVMMAPAVAFADDPVIDARGIPEAGASPAPSGELPAVRSDGDPEPAAGSDSDPEPPVTTPAMSGVNAEVVEQAGAGGDAGYARVGVAELGGAAGLTLAQDIRAVNFSPSIGWFLVDNFELSAVLDVTNLKAGAESATLWSALVEPSFHLPFNSTMFGMVGVGVGAAYVSELGTGMAVAPRIGLDFLIGRSGILRPSLSYVYTTHDTMGAVDEDGNTNVTLVSISSALRFNIGYSRMW